MAEKKYFKEGDLVVLRQEIPNRPIMVIEKIEKLNITRENESRSLSGIRCFWFDKNGGIQKNRFNFKDLTPVE